MRITYLFDPLCGWCYGGMPSLEQLAAREDVTLELAPTGLFAGDGVRPLSAQFAAFAWQNDQRIARLTGQPFSEDYRTRILHAPDGLFDSAPATLGLIAVGLTDPQRELAALKALQRARYVDALDNMRPEIVGKVLEALGFATAARRLESPDEELLGAYRRRIEAGRIDMGHFGINGVPALIIGQGSMRRPIPSSTLFSSFDVLTAALGVA